MGGWAEGAAGRGRGREERVAASAPGAVKRLDVGFGGRAVGDAAAGVRGLVAHDSVKQNRCLLIV